MNDKKICFILCVNDDIALSEALYYIGRLNVPGGYELEYLTVTDATSMTSGYNEAMNSADAKYKIYMHQDVLITNRDILNVMLNVFKDEKVGMMGLVGLTKIPESAVTIFSKDRVGKLCSHNNYSTTVTDFGKVEGSVCEVKAIDGLFMATQYDLPWREDILDGWDFYDVSQSFEFIRKGLKVVVPRQDDFFCIHDDGFLDLKNYYKYRRILKDNYPEFF